MDDVNVFRNAMAESGVEYTPVEAKKAMNAAIEFQSKMDQMALEEPELFDNIRELTFADKQAICREFSENGIEVSPDELEDLFQLILYARDKDLDEWQK